MNKLLLHTEVQDFISDNLNSNITEVLLKKSPFQNVDTREIIEQIEAKKRAFKKLPTWYNTSNIYYSNKLNIEQTSSELTANYKASLISGDTIIDITGGFGVDCLAFSKQFKQVTHCEINKELSQIVAHNYKQLQVKIETIPQDGMLYLKSIKKTFDWIYIDPSRRHDSKGKVFFLKDCLPNVPEHLDLLFSKSDNILVKTSPLLDITSGASELQFVKAVHVVAVNNEVKELLWVLNRKNDSNFSIHTVNINKSSQDIFSFKPIDEANIETVFSEPLTYLYEPNAAILKAGGFNSIANYLSVFKLHKHSHIYTSSEKITFPGRSFKIIKTVSFNKKAIRKEGITKANITTRNFPETVQNLRKKFKIKDGGDIYMFFTTDSNDDKIVLICSKA